MVRSIVKVEKISIKNSPELNEVWVQDLIAEDPSIIGLGDLVLRDKERIQPRAGRLDLLLQDPDTLRRYEVEVQLGPTDESHIIRTLEYWDIERKRYPQYDHCAVIIAEEITGRFHNVISLFNGTIPIIAIQINALKLKDDDIALIFTKVLDELTRGLVDEDEDVQSIPTDRDYWENRATKLTVGFADNILKLLRGIDESLNLKYNKMYIGLEKEGRPFNFFAFRPRKNRLNLDIKIPRTEDIDLKIDEAGLDTLEYNKNWGVYRITLKESDIEKNSEFILELARIAYDRRVND